MIGGLTAWKSTTDAKPNFSSKLPISQDYWAANLPHAASAFISL
jgi:hypothetical protein